MATLQSFISRTPGKYSAQHNGFNFSLEGSHWSYSSTLLMFHYIYDVKLTLTYQMTQQACLQTELLHTQQGWNGYRACQVLTTHQCWNEPGPVKKAHSANKPLCSYKSVQKARRICSFTKQLLCTRRFRRGSKYAAKELMCQVTVLS